MENSLKNPFKPSTFTDLENCYLSPEGFRKAMNPDLTINVDTTIKSDVYSNGLVLISACLLENVETIYGRDGIK